MGNTENSGNGKRLTKSKNKMLCGVCGGIAEYFNIDPTVVRLIVVFLALAGVGSGLLAYIVAAIIMPDSPAE
ncbi:MAG: PspC domain-containing protein [Spirochaetaceae bacterium]|nr:PspC domain-containing protein [Spirochaetaceae bacterium]